VWHFDWHFDADARVFYVPSWWRWNPPENENVLKGNLKALSEIPPSKLADGFARNTETLDETLRPTFMECCQRHLPRRLPNQEQGPEPGQNPKQEYDRAGAHQEAEGRQQ
jgi:hypothetical protein